METVIAVRNVNAGDYSTLRMLAKACAPLDLHTPYTYWVCCRYFSEYCFLLEDNAQPIGYIMGLCNAECVFVWQIGIKKEYCGRGLSGRLIDSIVATAKSHGYSKLQTTIDPQNVNSNLAFSTYADKHGYQLMPIGKLTVEDLQEHMLETENEVVFEMKLL